MSLLKRPYRSCIYQYAPKFFSKTSVNGATGYRHAIQAMKRIPTHPLWISLVITLLTFAGHFDHAHAQVLNDWGSNDLMIGFRASGGTGSSDSYLVNIGSAANFNTNRDAATLSLGGIGADLTAKYGGDWYSRSDLFWGMFGTTISAAPTLYSSVARSDSNAQSTPPPSVTDPNNRSGTASQITSVTSAFNLLSPTANSTNAAFQPNTASPSSYNYQVTQSGTDFGSISQWNNIQGNLNQILDLYGQNNSGTFWRGGFSLNNSGTIAFNPTIIPEPSTYALLGIGAVLLGAAYRRKTNPKKS